MRHAAANTAGPAPQAVPMPLAHAVDRGAGARRHRGTALLGETSDGKQIRVGTLAARHAAAARNRPPARADLPGGGRGHRPRLDLDAFDTLVRTHRAVGRRRACRIAGAYRVARGAPVLAAHGLAACTPRRCSTIADDAIAAHARRAWSSGRSFVAPDYWGSRSLDYLWQGIGAYLRAHPEVRYLFGPVSISAALPLAAREQMVAYYAALLRWRCRRGRRRTRPFALPGRAAALRGDWMPTPRFRVLKANLDALGATGADALQAVHRAVRARRCALPRVRRRSGLQRLAWTA